MEHLLTHKTVSITELREPAKVLEKAGSSPVAVLKNNECVAYLVPASTANGIEVRRVSRQALLESMAKTRDGDMLVWDYLKDK